MLVISNYLHWERWVSVCPSARLSMYSIIQTVVDEFHEILGSLSIETKRRPNRLGLYFGSDMDPDAGTAFQYR